MKRRDRGRYGWLLRLGDPASKVDPEAPGHHASAETRCEDAARQYFKLTGEDDANAHEHHGESEELQAAGSRPRYRGLRLVHHPADVTARMPVTDPMLLVLGADLGTDA